MPASPAGWCSGASAVQRLEAANHIGVDQYRLGELGAAVHDAVADRVDRTAPLDHPQECVGVEVGAVAVEGGFGDPMPGVVDDAQLDVAGAGVDDQDGHQPGQAQSRIWGRSSPWERVHARAVARMSTISWRIVAACDPSELTRSITSMTRWKRSKSLSMTMSNGVVVVPSSL